MTDNLVSCIYADGWHNKETDMKKVAVLLASYNGERYIGRQIESIMKTLGGEADGKKTNRRHN